MGLHLTTPSAAALGLSILLGWLAGGLANWAADVLPGRGPGKAGGGAASDPEAPPTVPTPGRHGPIAALHYLTLPWYPFRRGVCPHCGERPAPPRAAAGGGDGPRVCSSLVPRSARLRCDP